MVSIYRIEKQEKAFYSAFSYVKSGDFIEAREQLQPLADDGNCWARHWLGSLYALGLGGEIERNKGLEYLDCQLSNSLKNGEREYFIAMDFLDGIDDTDNLVGKNKAEGIFWMQQEKAKGFDRAVKWSQENL